MAGPDPKTPDEGDVPEDEDLLDDILPDEDEELLDEEPEPEPDEDLVPDEDETEVQPQRKASRPAQRIQRLANDNRELRERLARLEGSHDALTRQPAPPPRQEPEPDFSLMTAEERFNYQRDKDRRETAAFVINQTMQQNDKIDRIAFQSSCRENPAFKSVAADVETKIKELLAKNQGVPDRETIATFLIGQKYLKTGLTKAQKAADAAAAKTKRHKVKAPGAGSDVTHERRSGTGKTAEERLMAAHAKGFRF